MKTSSFVEWGNKPGGISIARTVPNGRRGGFKFAGPQFFPLTPTPECLKMANAGDPKWRDYYRKEVLGRAGWSMAMIEDIVGNLNMMAAGEDGVAHEPVLLCWEKKPVGKDGEILCHRKIVSNWFGKKLGIIVEEIA